MKKKNKLWLIGIGILLLLLVGGFAGFELEKKLSPCTNSLTTINNQIEGTCDDGGKYRCYITCTDTPPTRTYSCCSGGTTHLVQGCYVGSCPSGYSLISTSTSQSNCESQCNLPNLPTDSSTCRDYSTDQGYSASGWDGSVTSLSGCQYYALGHGCSVPSKIDYVNNCCFWSC